MFFVPVIYILKVHIYTNVDVHVHTLYSLCSSILCSAEVLHLLCISSCLSVYFHMHLPLLQALIETTDQHIYNELMKGNRDNTFLKG